MNDIEKPNDMFVSTLMNGDVNTLDLLQNGINAGNTQLLDPESYKSSKLVLSKFTDKDGNFRDDEFNKAYAVAAKQYSDLAEMNTYKKLSDYIEYNQKDIFAPLDAKKSTPTFEIEQELNPMRLSHGVDSLFDYGKSTMSMRELAQQSKIWDSENKKWLDKTADERGILGSLFGQSLVYATYDQDEDTEDPNTGRIIHHKKGEWKLNDKGQYYTETIGNRSSYGKQFVAASDTLTREDSALNKVDFFDSDDLEKSIPGTIAKTAVKILPYMFPQTRLVFGGATAAIEMAKVMPTFAKMIEGVAVGGDENNDTAFTRAMTSWENYMGKFAKSYSDKGMESNWGAEKMLDLVADTFAQLYQMRAAASISTLAVKDPTRNAIKKFLDDYLPRFIQAHLTPNSGFDIAKDSKGIVDMAVQKLPEIAEAIKAQSKLSKSLSVGYMALSSSADVYSDALAGGYDRRMAGLAGIAAALGQYGIMMKEDTLNLGGWFLDSSVGYSEGVQRKTMLDALRPHYDEIAKAIKSLDLTASKEEKVGIIQKTLGKLTGAFKEAKLGSRSLSQYLKNGVTEGTEEVVEEAIMDATKGAFDFMSWAGFGSNKNASFGVVEDFKQGTALDRYLQNAVGGFMGGVLFEFQQNKVEPWMNKVLYGKVKDDVQPSLIHEIANGHAEDLMKAVDELAAMDSDVAAIPISLDGKTMAVSADGQLTRGLATAKVLKDYIKVLEGVMVGENTDLTDDEVLEKAVRDYQAISILKKGGLDKLLISDFTKLSSSIVSVKTALDAAEKKEQEANKDKSKEDQAKDAAEVEKKAKELFESYIDDGNYSDKSAAFLRKLLEKKRADLKSFLDGEKAEFYTYKTLVGGSPLAKTAVGDLSIYDFTYLRYGKEWGDLHAKKGILTQEQVKKEYDLWVAETDADKKFLKLGVEAYADFDKRFALYITKYAQSRYGDTRKITYAKLLSAEANLGINDILDDEKAYNSIKAIANSLKDTSASAKTGDVTLEDIFALDDLLLKSEVKKIVERNPKAIKLLQLTGKTVELIENELSIFLMNTLSQVNVDNLSGQTLTALVNNFLYHSSLEILDLVMADMPEKNLGSLQDYLNSKGLMSTALDPMPEHLAITDKNQLSLFFAALAELSNLDDISLGLGTSLLKKYIAEQDTIDGTVRLRIAQEACKNIIARLSLVQPLISEQAKQLLVAESVTDGDILEYTVTANDIKELLDELNDKFDAQDPADIIKNWATKVAQKWLNDTHFMTECRRASFSGSLSVKDVKDDPNKLVKATEKIINDWISDDSMYQLYLQVKTKEVKENPVYDSLSKIDMTLSDGGKSKVLEVLQLQHAKLRLAERFEDYLPLGEARILLENALRAVRLYEALVSGMSEGPLSFGMPFAINQQMKRFVEKNGIKTDHKYDTIDAESAELITADLKLIESKLKGYLQLGDRAYKSKTAQDATIKKLHTKALLDAINAKATAFTVHDFSLLPPENERAKFTHPEEALAYYAHKIFLNFQAHFTSAESRREAIHELITNLNLRADQITRASKPTNLSLENPSLTDYDLVLWLATALSADEYEFYYRYNLLIVANGENKNTPLYSQETAALQAWAFILDQANLKGTTGNISVHDAITEELFLVNPDLAGIPASRLFFVNGITGAGKTTVVGSIVSLLCSDKLIYVTAANKLQVQNYVPAIKKYASEKEALQSGSISTLLDQFFGKENKATILAHIRLMQSGKLQEYYQLHPTDSLLTIKEFPDGGRIHQLDEKKVETLLMSKIDTDLIPEIVLIDEATQVPLPMLLLLNFLGKKFNFKVILSGDSVQRGATFGTDTLAFNDLFMWKSAKLNVSIRAANNLISTNNVAFNRLLEVYEGYNATTPGKTAQEKFASYITDPNNLEVISYYEDEAGTNFNGYKFVDNLANFAKDILVIAKLNQEENDKHHSTKKVMVITPLDEHSLPINTGLKELLALNGLLEGSYELFSPADLHDKAVQGSEARYVIVDAGCIADSVEEKPGEVLRSIYTLASRAERGTLMVIPTIGESKDINDTLARVGIRQRKDRITQLDEIPQLREVDKLKETRKKELEGILKGYKGPAKVTLDKVKTKKDGEKTIYIRSTSIPKVEASSGGGRAKSEVPGVRTLNHDSDEKLKGADYEDYLKTLNKDINPELFSEGAINAATGDTTGKDGKERSGGFVAPKSPTTSTRVSPALVHAGVKKNGKFFEPRDTGINFDMDGLFDQTRIINPAVMEGFIKFKHLLIAAKSKEDIWRGIESDRYIAYFLAEAAPQVAVSQGLTLDNWADTDDLCKAYSLWFRTNVEIDPNYYVFAKRLSWEEDLPYNIANPDIKKSVGEGNVCLYYGIKLVSHDPQGTLINQYISLGYLSKKTDELKSRPLIALYSLAEADLSSGTKFMAYSLPETLLYDLDLTSTMWIRNIKLSQEDGSEIINWNRFESVEEMERRGFSIDRDHVYLIDDKKVLVNGKSEFKALVFLAAYGTTSADINKYFEGKKLTFEQRLEKLRKIFAPEDELLIAGSYLTFARYVNPDVISSDTSTLRSSQFNRIIFLNPKRSTAEELFMGGDNPLTTFLTKEAGKPTPKVDLRTRLARCRPASLTRMIASILASGKAFEHIEVLEKYLLGMRMYLNATTTGEHYSQDKKTLNGLINWVKECKANGTRITAEDFIKRVNQEGGHRILLYPLFFQFCYKDGSDLVLRNVNNYNVIEQNGEEILDMDKKIKVEDIRLNLDLLPESYACPPLTPTPGRVDITSAEAFDLTLPDGINLDKDTKLDFLLISFNDESAKSLGMYGFLIQDPVFLLLDKVLEHIEKHPERLEQLLPVEVDSPTGKVIVDPRFPARAAWKDVPTLPPDFDPSVYAPLKLSGDDYIVDKNAEHIHDRFDTSKKPTEFLKHWDPKQKKWVETKGKDGKPIPKYPKVGVLYGDYGKAKEKGKAPFISMVRFNKMGFEVRPGDYVQLYGLTDRSFYIEKLDVSDPNDVKILLTYSGGPSATGGKPYMRRISETGGKWVTIDAVTKVVKRTVKDAEDKKNDIYLTGKFDVTPKFQLGKYALLAKTNETLEEMVKAEMESGEQIPSIDFDRYFYIAVPILSDDLGDLSAMSDPGRGTYYPIESLRGLLQFNAEATDPDKHPEWKGYTLYQVIRQPGMTPAQLESQLDFISKIQEHIQDALIHGNGLPSKYIQHFVLFDLADVDAIAKNLRTVDISDVLYKPLELAKLLMKPELLLPLSADGTTIDLKAVSEIRQEGVIRLTLSEYDAVVTNMAKTSGTKRELYPETKWMHKVVLDPVTHELYYEMIPKAHFIFASSKADDGNSVVYDLSSNNPEVVTHENYDRFIIGNEMSMASVIKVWKSRLIGYTFADYQARTLQRIAELKSNTTMKESDKKKLLAEAYSQLSTLVIDGENDIEGKRAPEFVITDVTLDSGLIKITYQARPNPGEEFDPNTKKSVLLSGFISEIGSRFIFRNGAGRMNFGGGMPVAAVAYTAPKATPSRGKTYGNTTADSDPYKDPHYNIDELPFTVGTQFLGKNGNKITVVEIAYSTAGSKRNHKWVVRCSTLLELGGTTSVVNNTIDLKDVMSRLSLPQSDREHLEIIPETKSTTLPGGESVILITKEDITPEFLSKKLLSTDTAKNKSGINILQSLADISEEINATLSSNPNLLLVQYTENDVKILWDNLSSVTEIGVMKLLLLAYGKKDSAACTILHALIVAANKKTLTALSIRNIGNAYRRGNYKGAKDLALALTGEKDIRKLIGC